MAYKMGIKFSVGYQWLEGRFFRDIVEEFKDRIEEVYFPWLNLPSGRGPIGEKTGYIRWEAQKQLEEEIKDIKKMGIKLNLLLNASCWGDESLSLAHANLITSILDYLVEDIGIDAVTTFSPVTAYIVKKDYPEIEIKASVNMRIGTIRQMEQAGDLFDSFIMQREYNRDFGRIEELKKWCEKNGKRLSILVNSGCLNFCSVQLFHDNIVSHETDVFTKVNIKEEIPGNCWWFYKKEENRKYVLSNSWIRPEDIYNYKDYFSVVKLATRINPEPEKIIQAYYYEKYEGNLLDIFEPSHSKIFHPYIVDNSKFPEEWFRKVTACDKSCHRCSYCLDILHQVLVKPFQKMPDKVGYRGI